MLHRVCLLICLLALAAPAAAVAQSNPFGPLPGPQAPEPAPTGEDTDTNEGDQDLAGWQKILIFGGGGILILGIAYVILRDARRHAPVEDRRRRPDDITGGLGSDKPKDPHAPRRKAQARQKQKAARAARKRTKRGR